MNDIKMIKGFSSAYPLVCDLKILPNIDGTWITIQDDVGTSMTVKLSDLSDFIKADVLDKIRAEIDGYCSDNRDRNDGLYIAMRIIDKHLHEIESEVGK